MVEAFLDEEWESLSKMFSSPDILVHEEIPYSSAENMASGVDETSFFTFDDTNFYCFSQESSNSSDIIGSSLFSNQYVNQVQQSICESLDFPLEDVWNNYNSQMMPPFSDHDVMEEILYFKENHAQTAGDSSKEIQLKRNCEAPEILHQDKSQEKKPRLSRNAQKNQQSKKKKKKLIKDNDNIIQSSSSCTSEEDDSNGDSKASAPLNSNGKARANRVSATDPQSLYARRRRERINDRLKILQNLVPNGTKVDISTMLEEAVDYVKFLELQIKLLSSDDLWMYAPIAYNGMDIGIYQRISPSFLPPN